jgi:hypothetical protein
MLAARERGASALHVSMDGRVGDAVDVHGAVVASAGKECGLVAGDVGPPCDGVDGTLAVATEHLKQLARRPMPDVDIRVCAAEWLVSTQGPCGRRHTGGRTLATRKDNVVVRPGKAGAHVVLRLCMAVQPANKLGLDADKRPDLDLVWVAVDDGRLAVARELEARELAGQRRAVTPGGPKQATKSQPATQRQSTGKGRRTR